MNGVNGLIILPDDWNTSYHFLNNTNTSGANYTTNTIDLSTWTSLEAHGAVFLPAAGYRYYSYGPNVNYAGSKGFYWSSTPDDDDSRSVNFSADGLSTGSYDYRLYGESVRLVQDVH